MSLSRDGKWLATGGEDSIAILWDVHTGQKVREFTAHSDWVSSVSLSADGKLLSTGSYDNSATVWDAGSGLRGPKLKGHSDSVVSVSISDDGKRLVTSSCDKTAILWNVETNQVLHKFAGPVGLVDAYLSKNGDSLFISYEDGSASIWDLREIEKRRTK